MLRKAALPILCLMLLAIVGVVGILKTQANVSESEPPIRAASDSSCGIEEPVSPYEAIQDKKEAQAFDFSFPGAIGGDIPPERTVYDPFPSFNGIALDTTNNVVVMSDTNRKGLLMYSANAGSLSKGETNPIHRIMGPKTGAGFIAGVALDPVHHETFTVNNDIEDRMVVFPYDAEGNSSPSRVLYVPHQAWGLSLLQKRDQIAMTVQTPNEVLFYRREAKGLEAPVGKIRGEKTMMADPHGICYDDKNNELVVANHGNWRQADLITAYTAHDDPNVKADRVGSAKEEPASGAGARGEFRPSSVTIFDGDANGDVAPKRILAGPRTRLNWPMGVTVDAATSNIVVANNGNNSVVVFSHGANGNAAPIQDIHGSRTGIVHPMGVAVDPSNGDIWVANFGDHTALVFAKGSTGNVPPKRIIRNAPEGSATCGFGNPYAAVYDPNHDVILVPN